jgi:hypothetical protein
MRWRRFLPANAGGGILWAVGNRGPPTWPATALQRAAGKIDWVLPGFAARNAGQPAEHSRQGIYRSAGRAQQARDLMDAAAESELHRPWKEDRR